MIDSIEVLFAGLATTAILRTELNRLFLWLKKKRVTAIITGERGEKTLTRHGLEEYVADCVILLDQRIEGQMATRRLRIVKYRGSAHGTNEYPFLIDEGGLSIVPITSMGLNHDASSERVSSGVPALDAMLDGKGFFCGSSVLVSGTAGTGKSSLAAHFAKAAITRGERCAWFAFEESPNQIMRNMRSIGINLAPAVQAGTMRFNAARPTNCGLEMHLVNIFKEVNAFKPRVVVIDPISNFEALGSAVAVKAMLTSMIDFFKMHNITALITTLTTGGGFNDAAEVGVASLMDAWLLLRDVQSGADRNRVLYLLKSRGMAHSNQVREFLLTDTGVQLREVYVGPSGDLLTGSARNVLEAEELATTLAQTQATAGRQREREHKRKAMEAQVVALRAQFDAEQAEADKTDAQERLSTGVLAGARTQMTHQRQGGSALGKTAKLAKPAK